MKTLKSLLIGIALFLAGAANSQISVNINIGSPPPWGPSGYTEMRYYYLPDVEAYYDVQSAMFIYFVEGAWIRRAYLPSRYKDYDLYGGYKVVMNDYRGETPYVHFKEHKIKYFKGYNGGFQKTNSEKPGKGNSFKQEDNKKNGGADQGNGKKEFQEKNKGPEKNHGNGGKGKKK